MITIKSVFYYFIREGQESKLDDIHNLDIIQVIDYDFSNDEISGVIIEEVDDTQSKITLWAESEKELRTLIKSQKERWLKFSQELKANEDEHYKQFENLSKQFNSEGRIFTLNLPNQISYP